MALDDARDDIGDAKESLDKAEGELNDSETGDESDSGDSELAP